MRTRLAVLATLLSPSLVSATPRISVDRRLVDFGVQAPSSAPVRALDVRNSGDSDLTISRIDYTSAIQGSWCSPLSLPLPLVIAPRQHETLMLALNAFKLGRVAGTLTIASDDPGTPALTVGVTERVVPDALAVDPKVIDFGTVRVPADVAGPAITIVNHTSDAVTLNGYSLFGDASSFAVEGVDADLVSGGSQVLGVRFVGTRGGPQSATLELSSFGSVLVHVELRALGLVSAVAATPRVFDFEPTVLGQSSDVQVVTIMNVTAAALSVASVGADDPDFELVGLALPAPIEPGQGLTLGVRFTPSRLGDASARIAVAIDGLDGPEQVIAAHAVGVAPPSDPAPPPIAAGCSLAPRPTGALASALALVLALGLAFGLALALARALARRRA